VREPNDRPPTYELSQELRKPWSVQVARGALVLLSGGLLRNALAAQLAAAVSSAGLAAALLGIAWAAGARRPAARWLLVTTLAVVWAGIIWAGAQNPRTYPPEQVLGGSWRGDPDPRWGPGSDPAALSSKKRG